MTIIKPMQQNDDVMSWAADGAPWHAGIRRGPRGSGSPIVNVIGPVYRYRLKVAEHYLATRADGFTRADAFDVTAYTFGLDLDVLWHILNWMGVHPLPRISDATQNGNLRYAEARADHADSIGQQIHHDNRRERDHAQLLQPTASLLAIDDDAEG